MTSLPLPPCGAPADQLLDPLEQLEGGAPTPGKGADATPSASLDQQAPNGSADGGVKKPVGGGGGGSAPAKSKQRTARKRIAIVVDPASEMQIRCGEGPVGHERRSAAA